jgi:hypothetical protein
LVLDFLFSSGLYGCIVGVELEKDLCAMKRFTVSAFALAAGLVTAVPAVAQDVITRQGNETAMEMAMRVGACGGQGINSAEFVESGGLRLQVQCAGGFMTSDAGNAGMTGGLGGGGAAAAVGLLFVAAVAGAGGSSGTTGTN